MITLFLIGYLSLHAAQENSVIQITLEEASSLFEPSLPNYPLNFQFLPHLNELLQASVAAYKKTIELSSGMQSLSLNTDSGQQKMFNQDGQNKKIVNKTVSYQETHFHPYKPQDKANHKTVHRASTPFPQLEKDNQITGSGFERPRSASAPIPTTNQDGMLIEEE